MIPKKVHMVGIGGAGMAAIAKVLLEMGCQVSGSDLASTDVTKGLAALGAQVAEGHCSENVKGDTDVCVVSTAIKPDNPEVLAARAAGIPVWHRSQMLAEIMNSRVGIAVAGAHGKTTITSMLAWVLHWAGQQPTFLIGGEVAGLGGARYGVGRAVVAEADESDRSFLRYTPHYAIVTSIEADHLEHYEGSFSLLVDTFAQFLGNIVPGGVAVLCSEDQHLRKIGPFVQQRIIWYGATPDCAYQCRNVRSEGYSTVFDVWEHGRLLGEFRLAIPGRHNVLNSLSVIAVCRELGLAPAEIAPHLATFKGARRRFEVIAEKRGILIVDDYAHHPSEIRATIQAAKTGWPDRRVVAVFQPHRYTRTHYLLDDFAKCFGAADHLVLTEVYAPPPDEPIPGASGSRLAELTRQSLPELPVDFVPARAALAPHLAKLCGPGDIVLTMGAGDIWRTTRELSDLL